MSRVLLLLGLVVRQAFRVLVLRATGRGSPQELAVGLRRSLEGMGLTYVKLGQYLSLRMDLLPREACVELGKLFERARPMSPEAVRRRVEEELGGALEDVFPEFDMEPLGSASIAQVHRARTAAGEVVAVKLQRFDLERTFRSDMRLFRALTRFVDRHRLLGAIPVTETLEQFSLFTLRELDFFAEARIAETVRHDVGDRLMVPRVDWALSTQRLLTMEFVRGVSLQKVFDLYDAGQRDEVERLLPGVDLQAAVLRIADACLFQLFSTGRFHGDPHPGNLLIRPDGAPVLIDFGIYGMLTRTRREELCDYMEAIAMGRFERAARVHDRLSVPTDETDVASYHRDFADIMSRWFSRAKSPDAPAEERHLGSAIGEITELQRRYHVRMEPDQLLVWRAIGLLDATALRVPEHVDLLALMEAFFLRTRPTPMVRLLRLVGDKGVASASVQEGLSWPGQARALLADARRDAVVNVHRERASGRGASGAVRPLALAVSALGLGILSLGGWGGGMPMGLSLAAAVALAGLAWVLASR
ncbi:AarF/ABC1/UbiB kinase family protein [Myxococcaceae bacterium JPH2]|nr:AarF/ABC1/UbiB kinase family protein [Myxococcaceae bacterium JPH2]